MATPATRAVPFSFHQRLMTSSCSSSVLNSATGGLLYTANMAGSDALAAGQRGERFDQVVLGQAQLVALLAQELQRGTARGEFITAQQQRQAGATLVGLLDPALEAATTAVQLHTQPGQGAA